MTKVPMPVCRIQDGQMMRDNRIMRTDRPGGNIRLFLCKMKKKKKEVENMKSKYRFRRILSGVMAAVTILSTVISPLTVYASEEPKAAEPPAYESVKDQLDENEVVKATDLELEVGQDFDVSTDFTNLEIKDESKVKVTFQKAENDAGENFSTSHADIYHAVYYVEPVNQNHPVYQIGRNLIVKEPVTAAQSEPQTEQAVTEEDTGSDDEEAASQEETETVPVETEIVEPETAESETEEPEETEPEFQGGLSESEFDAALEEAETENTTDKESGLTLSDVLEQAGEQDIDLMAMEDGETVSFTAVNTSTRATQDVDVTRGTAYYYADYGLGSYVTYKYTVKFGNVSATAYCVQPSKAGPGDGVYKITKLGDSKALAKVCYYGTKASGENGFFSEKHPDFSAGKQFIIVHLAASYANNSSDAFSGTNATGQALAMELYNYCMSQPEIPEVDMSFSNADVTAYISGNSQRTEEITFKASELQTITMKLPSGVKLHNVTTGKTSSAGASVEICGGTKFYLSAPLTQAVDVKGEWSVTMKGSIIKDYSAYKITTGSETQDLALVFGEGVTDEKYVDFKVSWVKQATLEIVKKDRKSNKAIAGAVYGVYSDKDGKNLFLLGSNTMQKMGTDSESLKPISYQAHVKMDLAAERDYMFNHVYKQEQKRFYNLNMHGIDWDAMTKAYRKFLPHIDNNYDFAELLSEYLGELNVSHTGGRFRPQLKGDATATLGLLYDWNHNGKGLLISEVVEKGPFDHARSKVKAGDIIEKIDGQEITPESDYSVLLNGKARKKTLVTLYNPQTKERWEEVVVPVSNGVMSDLLYARWVKQRAADVDKWSNGRLGYVHIESMGDDSFRSVYSDILGKYNNREGIVIDTRFNGGGRLHEDIEILFSGKKYFTQVVRGREACDMPSRRWNKPSIMVQCEANYSNAHGTPWVYSHQKIGKLVGMPVPGTMTSVSWETLQDPTLVFGIPVIGYRLPDGSYLENSQLEPDIKVANSPETVVKGEDTQLKAAVDELLKEIDGK